MDYVLVKIRNKSLLGVSCVSSIYVDHPVSQWNVVDVQKQLENLGLFGWNLESLPGKNCCMEVACKSMLLCLPGKFEKDVWLNAYV
jgi:hypothetical protein